MKMRTVLHMLFTLLIVVLLQNHMPAQNKNIVTRGMWMWGSTLSSQGTTAVVNKLNDSYVNRVYLLVKGTGGSKTSGSLLTEFITAAHAKGIEVHLWYIVADDNLYVTTHSGAHQYHAPKPGTSNDPYPNTDSKVNLLYPGYKEYVLDNIKFFLENYDCDGIHLDVIRYGHLVYSFDQNHLQKAESLGCNTNRILQLFRDNYNYYANSTGFFNLYASGDSDVVKWVDMRKDIIHDYISAIRDLIDQVKPGIELNAAFMPEGANQVTLADVHYAQNYSLNSPLLDEISPMAYFNSYGQPTSWLKTITQEAIKRVSSNCRIVTGFQTFDGVTANQVKEQIQYSLDGGAGGVIGFRYGTTTSVQWEAIKQVFKELIPKEVTTQEMYYMCRSVCDSMTASPVVPDLIYTNEAETSFVSAADFYYMMVNYLRYYLDNDSTSPGTIQIIRNIAGPTNPTGVQTDNQIMLADILSSGKNDAAFVDSNNKIPDCVSIGDSIDYDPPAMFWVYARTVNWYATHDFIMPNYATVRVCSAPNTWTYGDNVTSVKDEESQINSPDNFLLYQNYPNPFNPATTFRFRIANPGFVSLKIYDVLGNEIVVLVNEEKPAGEYNINFDVASVAGGLPSGVYMYRLTADNVSSAKKMMLLK